MKHLILSGGRPWLSGDHGKQWVDALLAHAGKQAHIAYCLFAQDETEWAGTLKSNQELVAQHAGEVQVACKTLTAENFNATSAWANVIVIVGGDPAQLKNTLEQFGDLMDLWDGKTISGSSAGADIMTRRYMYLQDKIVQEGFGWLPVNFIPHWQSDFEDWAPKDWQWAANQLAGEPGAAPLLTVREGDFIEIVVK